MMKSIDFKILIKKIKGSLSHEEDIIFNDWYHDSVIHQKYFEDLKNNYETDLVQINSKRLRKNVYKVINRRERLNRKRAYRLAVSIAVLTGLANLAYFMNTKPGVMVETPVEIISDNNHAVLTLENGANYTLNKEKNFTVNNVKINGDSIVYADSESKSEILEYNYLTIPRGSSYYVVLSDGTKVWLNAESKLKFPKNFIQGQARQVELMYGEAYFDVTQADEVGGDHFNVISDSQQIEVMGTEFNVKSYKYEEVTFTTLVNGKIKLNIKDDQLNIRPNQRVRLHRKNGDVKINEVNVYDEIAWRFGEFSFHSESLEEIMQVISRWYDVDVVFNDSSLKSKLFDGVFHRSKNLEDIMKLITKPNKINYEKIDRTIYIR